MAAGSRRVHRDQQRHRRRPIHARLRDVQPYVEQNHFSVNAAGTEPTRYQRIDADLRNLALVPALAIRFGSDFRIGVAPGFLFSTGRLSFAEQTVPGSEDPATDARYDLDSGQSIADARSR